MNTAHRQRRLAALQFQAELAESRQRLSLMHPQFNMREIAKQMVLLEDHLAHTNKHCPDCIRKHLLTIEALAEEAVALDQEGTYRETGERCAEAVRRWLEEFHDHRPASDLGQEIRLVRKVLVQLVADPREAVARVAARHIAVSDLCPHQRATTTPQG